MSDGKQDTDLENLFSITVFTCQVKSSSDIFRTCLTTVPPKGANVYNMNQHANIYLNIQGSVGPVFLLQKDSETKDVLCIAYPLQVEEEK